jgi:hypothetical protein
VCLRGWSTVQPFIVLVTTLATKIGTGPLSEIKNVNREKLHQSFRSTFKVGTIHYERDCDDGAPGIVDA